MQSFDVAVIGGGPAGSSCARNLVQEGLKVVVLDKSEFPREKVCAGWITPAVLDALELDVEDYRRGRTLQPIEAFRAGLNGRPAVTVSYGRTVSHGIRRCEFDDYLLRRSGATLRLAEPLRTMARRGERWVINDALEAGLLIGAGGHFCPVARHLGADVGRDEAAVFAQELEFPMDREQAQRCNVQSTTPELYFCDDLKGYAWCLRKGDFLNVGLGREEGHGLAEQLKAFSEWLVAQGRIPAAPPGRVKGHAYLLSTRSSRAVVDSGVLLVGDAAGLAYAQSGEGILPAIESGIMAARTVVAANGEYTRERLSGYGSALRHRFGKRTTPRVPVAGGRWRRLAGRWLLTSRWFTQHVVLDRWFLHLRGD
jgi:geranylgeranyl reductase family protein